MQGSQSHRRAYCGCKYYRSRHRDLRPGVILLLVATFLAEHVVEDFIGCNVVIEPGVLRARRPPHS
jgi:hypothetical protein